MLGRFFHASILVYMRGRLIDIRGIYKNKLYAYKIRCLLLQISPAVILQGYSFYDLRNRWSIKDESRTSTPLFDKSVQILFDADACFRNRDQVP